MSIKDRVLLNPEGEAVTFLKQLGSDAYRKYYREARLLPENQLHISEDVTIYNQTFAICFWEKGEIVGIEIENSEFVAFQRNIFEILWKSAKPV